jgi:hypothetical protein
MDTKVTNKSEDETEVCFTIPGAKDQFITLKPAEAIRLRDQLTDSHTRRLIESIRDGTN